MRAGSGLKRQAELSQGTVPGRQTVTWTASRLPRGLASSVFLLAHSTRRGLWDSVLSTPPASFVFPAPWKGLLSGLRLGLVCTVGRTSHCMRPAEGSHQGQPASAICRNTTTKSLLGLEHGPLCSWHPNSHPTEAPARQPLQGCHCAEYAAVWA